MILHGDCLTELRKLDDDSIDALVTDPPYGLSKAPDIAEVMKHWLSGEEYKHSGYGFMQKSWDSFVPGPNYWAEVFRVMKPGAHGLVFAGTRTWDLMGISLRFAGFEIRDCIQWLYGSGFPKSLSIDKAIDKAAGAEREVVGSKLGLPGYRGGDQVASNVLTGGANGTLNNGTAKLSITAPSTDAAKQWQGFGTALKPAWEPVILIRKPCSEKTVAANVCKHGTGALNIDGCRIKSDGEHKRPFQPTNNDRAILGKQAAFMPTNAEGRFPANLVLSHSPECDETCAPGCAVAELDAQSGVSKSTGGEGKKYGDGKSFGSTKGVFHHFGDSGGASRFFLCATYDKSELCGLESTKAADTSVGKKTENKSEGLSIDGFGSSITDQYLMGTMSITEMGTHSIITFPILSASTKTCIGTITIESGKTIERSLVESVVGVSVASATEACLYFQNGQREPITGIVSLASESTSLAGVIKTVSTGTRTIGHIAPSRFFYCAKVSPSERNAGLVKAEKGTDQHYAESHFKNTHPTVKPIKLMRYLIRLITPPGGTVLDPFTGSGSTGVAAIQEGFAFLGIEREQEYVDIAGARLKHAEANV